MINTFGNQKVYTVEEVDSKIADLMPAVVDTLPPAATASNRVAYYLKTGQQRDGYPVVEPYIIVIGRDEHNLDTKTWFKVSDNDAMTAEQVQEIWDNTEV